MDTVRTGRREKRMKRSLDCFAIATLLLIVFRILFLTRWTGNIGNGFLVAPYMIFQICMMISGYCIAGTVYKMVRARVTRGQIRNAVRVFHASCGLTMVLGGLLTLIVWLSADTVTASLLHCSGAGDIMRILAPAIMLYSLAGCFRGMLNGFDIIASPAVIGLMTELITTGICIAGAGYYAGYGAKVGDLIRNPMMQYLYATKGSVIGVAVGAAVCLIALIVVLVLNYGRIRSMLRKDNTIRDENLGQTYNTLICSSFPGIGMMILFVIGQLIGIRYVSLSDGSIEALTYDLQCIGIYYVQMLAIVLIPIFIILQITTDMRPVLREYAKQDERKPIRDYLKSRIRYILLFTMAVSVYLFVMSEPVVRMLFGSSASELAIYLMGFGAILILLCSFIIPMYRTIIGIHQKKFLYAVLVVANIVGLIAMKIAITKLHMGVEGILVASILFAAVVLAGFVLIVRRFLRYRQEWVFSVFIPFVGAFIAGVVVWLIRLMLNPLHMPALSVVAGAAVYYVVYWLVIALLRGITAEELMDIPTGRIALSMLGRLHLVEEEDKE